jgi:hypothetical protein
VVDGVVVVGGVVVGVVVVGVVVVGVVVVGVVVGLVVTDADAVVDDVFAFPTCARTNVKNVGESERESEWAEQEGEIDAPPQDIHKFQAARQYPTDLGRANRCGGVGRTISPIVVRALQENGSQAAGRIKGQILDNEPDGGVAGNVCADGYQAGKIVSTFTLRGVGAALITGTAELCYTDL